MGSPLYIKINDFNVARLDIIDEYLPESNINIYSIQATLAIGSIYTHPFKSEDLEQVQAMLDGIKSDSNNGKRPQFEADWELSPFPVFRSPEYYRLQNLG